MRCEGSGRSWVPPIHKSHTRPKSMYCSHIQTGGQTPNWSKWSSTKLVRAEEGLWESSPRSGSELLSTLDALLVLLLPVWSRALSPEERRGRAFIEENGKVSLMGLQHW